MPRSSIHTRGSAQRTGLIAACVVGVVLIGTLGIIYANRPVKPQQNTTGPSMDPPPDVTNITPGTGSIAGAGKLFLQIVDPESPGRVQAEITADRSEPLPNRRVRMDKPRAWIYLRDGRSVSIQSDTGVSTTPETGANSRPDDAILEGNIVIRLYAAVPGQNRPTADDAPPVLTLRTTRLRLDAQRGELEIPERFSLNSDTLAFEGRELLTLFNESSQRIELLRVAERFSCFIKSGVGSPLTPAPTATPSGTPSAAAPSTATPPAAATARPEALYVATFPSDVAIKQSDRALTADRAQAFFRLIDNTLPANAIAPVAFLDTASLAPTAPTPTPATSTAPPSAPNTTPPSGVPGAKSPTSDEPIELVWSGPLEVVPVTAPIPELNGNHVHVRLTSDRANGVVAADPSSASLATGRRLDYAATRRDASISGDAAAPATMQREGLGTAKAARMDASLGTGNVRIPSPGSITSAPQANQPTRSIAWTREADFSFLTRDGRLTNLLREARVSGDVNATDASGTITANALTATFDSTGDTSRLTRLQAVGSATARDAEGSVVTGDSIDAQFAPLGDNPSSLTRALVSGSAAATNEGRTLHADRIEAFTASNGTAMRIERVEARGNAAFDSPDDQHASAPTIIAWPATQVAHLSGDGSRISQGQSAVAAPRIILDGKARTFEVPGPGTIHHAARRDDHDETATITWSTGLTYDDVAEVGTAVGTVRTILTRGPLDTDTMFADTATIELVTTTKPDGSKKRDLLSIDAIGGDTRASLETRRHRAGTSPAVLERLLYLEGTSIRANQADGTLVVPSGGKLLAVDHSPTTSQPKPSAAGVSTDLSRGTALFTWKDRFTLRRAAGEADMLGDARLIHDRGDGSPRSQLDADTLHAKFRERTDAAPRDTAEPLRADLLSAKADGDVRLLSGSRELRGDMLTYDATTAAIDAQATAPRLVTLADRNGASPVRAQSLRWFLRTDRIEVSGIRPVTTPR